MEKGHKAPGVENVGLYGGVIPIIETLDWTWGELQDQPADLVDELTERLKARDGHR